MQEGMSLHEGNGTVVPGLQMQLCLLSPYQWGQQILVEQNPTKVSKDDMWDI
jgi:hypothetical protein